MSKAKSDKQLSKIRRVHANESRGAGRPAGRAKAARRRHIDPTTCEREYSLEEREFMAALERYKRTSGRMFPTCSEVLEVVRSLGYRRVADEPTAVTV